jgi:tetratricopeptide (TPR) repeat protein
VLALRLKIYRALEKWDLTQVVAKTLVVRDPLDIGPWVSLAYAVRRAVSLDAAKAVLLQALHGLPDAAILHYNLACYECCLGDLVAAKDCLKRAITLDPRYRERALEDEDLAPLWEV